MKTKVAVLLSMLGLALAGVTQKVCSRKSCPFHITFSCRKHSILLKLKPRGYQNQFSTLDMELPNCASVCVFVCVCVRARTVMQ